MIFFAEIVRNSFCRILEVITKEIIEAFHVGFFGDFPQGVFGVSVVNSEGSVGRIAERIYRDTPEISSKNT